MPAVGARRTFAGGLALACLLVACGNRGDAGAHSNRQSNAATTSSPGASATLPGAGLLTSAASQAPMRVDARVAAVITRLLTSVFAHPESAQCASPMTPRYVSEAFGADAARSGVSPMAECREHQRLRAELPDAERRVTVQEIVMAGGGVHATVRGASGYPIGVTLSRRRATWRLDGFGVTAVPRGEGSEVAPAGSLYAYRIPPGFISGGTAIGAVQATGAAFSTSVILPDRRSAEGVAIAQGAFAFRIHDRAALRSAIPRLDRAVRDPRSRAGLTDRSRRRSAAGRR